jgi:hypothetical protein
MTNISRIISETIQSYLSDNLVTESGKKNIRKKALKKKGGLRGDLDVVSYERDNQKADEQEASEVEDWLKSNAINITAVADKLYPKLEPDSRGSKLNKKIYHKKSDSGYTYRLTRPEVMKIKQIKSSFD